MRQPAHKTTKLPRQLLDELGLNDVGTTRGKRIGPKDRKERRKAWRIEKKTKRARPTSERHDRDRQVSVRSKSHHSLEDSAGSEDLTSNESTIESVPRPKSILKAAKPHLPSVSTLQGSDSEAVQPRISKGLRDRLAADDAEIEALERALGVKGKDLTKTFEDDGLGDLLDNLDGEWPAPGKRKRTGEDEWLEQKRRKARQLHAAPGQDENHPGVRSEGTESYGNASQNEEVLDSGEYQGTEQASFDGFESESEVVDKRPSRTRENPYVAPLTTGTHNASTSTKYVPPSMRVAQIGETENLSRLRRQIQGLLNRLSEANILSILNDVEKLYREHPRQHVATTLIDLLVGLLNDPTSLQDTFIILHAGFIAAIYKVVGTDFGAQVVQRVVEEFDNIHTTKITGDSKGKNSTNLISLLAELYNFQVIGSGLVYDFIRIFLQDLSESNTELLLKVIRNSGPQLRHDDPSSLKDIVLLLHPSIAKLGLENLSVRTKFMIETINNLKNNRMKTGLAASSIASEHTIRMKKTLGSLSSRSIKASEPLRINLKDIRETEKRGKWWLVGASYRDDDMGDKHDPYEIEVPNPPVSDEENGDTTSGVPDLVQLAKAHRMNTDIRRSIFITIMSSTDYRDAHMRLLKLRLKKSQELEIPKVVIHCAGAERVYNPFYTLISRRLCSDRKLKMALQFSLWDLFKRMGEGEDGVEVYEKDEERDGLGMREIVNLAKMFGVLVADGGLGLGILKTLNLAYLQPKTRTFVELFLITVLVQSQLGAEGKRNEKAVMDIFLTLKDVPELTTGLQFFMKKVVRKTDVAGSKQDQATVKWGCKVADDALTALASTTIAEE